MAKAKILGTGVYAPGAPIGNGELARLAGIELDAARLEEKIGIRARHIARLRGLDESTADFAERAARSAIADAGLAPDDLDLVIVGTDTPEYVSPATAILVQGRLQGGQRDTAAFDVSASCASFVTALDAAARMMAGDPALRQLWSSACITCPPTSGTETLSAGPSSPTAPGPSSCPGRTTTTRPGT